MPGSYAFSIDDLVGNMQVPGTGINISIGGPAGLDNKDRYEKDKLLNVNLGDPVALKRPNWSQYGFCEGNPVRVFEYPNDLSFQITTVHYPCVIAVTDIAGRKYQFTVTDPSTFVKGPPPPRQPIPDSMKKAISNCTVTNAKTADADIWCKDVYAFFVDTTDGPVNYLNVDPPIATQ